MRLKFVKVREDKYRKDVREQMVEFVTNCYLKGKDCTLQDVQNVFRGTPFDLSEGTVINYLNELVDKRKLSTWKGNGNRRYYGPPKIPIPIKVGLSVGTIIIIACVMIDMFLPTHMISTYIYLGIQVSSDIEPVKITTLPIVIYSLAITAILTIIWYLSDRKLYK